MTQKYHVPIPKCAPNIYLKLPTTCVQNLNKMKDCVIRIFTPVWTHSCIFAYNLHTIYVN